jgi:hypothetical protein
MSDLEFKLLEGNRLSLTHNGKTLNVSLSEDYTAEELAEAKELLKRGLKIPDE